MSAKKPTTKRFNLVLPEKLYLQVQQIAEEEETTVIDIFRRFIKLGLLTAEIQKDPDAALIIKRGDTEREIILI